MARIITIPNDNGYVAAPGRLRLRDATFTFPASWQAVREPVWTPSRMAIATIGPGPIPLCANWSTCGLWPDMRLPADGVIESVWNRSDGDRTLAVAPGAPMTIGGQPAKLATGPVDAACAAIGGDELMTASLADTPGAQVGVEFDACLRGPDLATNEALVGGFLAAAVRTPHWTPDESPRASP